MRGRHGILRSCLVLLAALLYMAAAVNGPADFGGAYSNTGPQGSAAFAPADLQPHHAPPKESLSRPFNPPSPPKAKDRLAGIPALLASNGAVRTASVQAAFMDREVLLALRRCDLLFPFHFFW